MTSAADESAGGAVLAPPKARAARSSYERRRNRIALLIVLFFVLLPAEGVLRKWILNPIQQPLVLIRDPILLWIYWEYLGLSRRKPMWIVYWVAASVFALVFALIQYAGNPLPVLVYLIGYRAYLMYIPLAFIIRDLWRPADTRRWILVCLWLSIPIGLLVVAQFSSPVASPINKGLLDDISDIRGRFLVVEDIVRTYGPFTFTQAQSTYAALMVAVIVIGWERRNAFRLPFPLLLAASVATATMGALSGSRTFFGGALLILAAFGAAALTAPRLSRSASRLIAAVLFTGLFILVFMFVFPTSFAAMTERQSDAVAAEGSTFDRAIGMFSLGPNDLSETPVLGAGMGAGSNAASYLVNNGTVVDWYLGEYEWPRIIQELGPVVGLAFIAFRVWVFLWLGWLALQKNRQTGDASALVMFGFSSYLVVLGQVVAQNQLLSFCWFSVGITLALSRIPRAWARLPPRLGAPLRKSKGVVQ